MTKDTRILALDYGERRIGVAVSDPTGHVAQGLPTISHRGSTDAIRQVIEVVEGLSVMSIVVGLPLAMDGRKSRMADKVKQFVRRLSSEVTIPVVMWDERLTTVAARRALGSMRKSPSRNKEKVDQVAATMLLQSYLDSINV